MHRRLQWVCPNIWLILLATSIPSFGASFNWTPGTGSNGDIWVRKQNWTEQITKVQAVPTEADEAVFGVSAGSLTPTITGSPAVGSIRFTAGSSQYQIKGAGATLTLSPPTSVIGLQNDNTTATVTESISVGTLTLGKSQTWKNEGKLSITSGALNLGANQTLTVAGVGATTISSAIAGTGTSGLEKTGAGTLELTGTSSYSGLTTVSGGALTVSSAKGLGNTTGIALNPGANLKFGSINPVFGAVAPAMTLAGGTLTANDRSAQFGALNVTASSTIDLLANSVQANLTFTSASLTGGSVLTINNWTGLSGSGTSDRIFITAQPSSGFLSGVQFTGFPKGAEWKISGELAPVPEPKEFAIAFALGLLALAGFQRARRSTNGLARRQ